MRFIVLASLLSGVAFAARPFLNEPDTGLEIETSEGQLPPLEDLVSLPDFEAAARHGMDVKNYSYYRTGSAGEYSYRRSLEIYHEVKLRPRLLRDMSKVSMKTKILGYEFDAPFFIAPAAQAGLAHPRGELNFVEAAGSGKIMYAPSLSATKEIEEISSSSVDEQIMFHQFYVSANDTTLRSNLKRIEEAGYKALIVTVDNPIHGIRTREERYGWGNTTDHDPAFSWKSFKRLQSLTKLPVIPKGIQTVEDAKMAVKAGAKAIYVSNHGARQLDTSQLPLETLMEMRTYAPEIFDQVTVFADGGVRYGTDILKLLALGVHAVGIARPFMFANVYGRDGVEKMIDILKRELWVDMANLGVKDLSELNSTYVNTRRLEQYIYEM
ncbi:FMN-dependent dehydrogenase [Geopyxis carbonaria]|nr:FMN-dependent dehydrogenase [Geopyxis carbonaria]